MLITTSGSGHIIIALYSFNSILFRKVDLFYMNHITTVEWYVIVCWNPNIN